MHAPALPYTSLSSQRYGSQFCLKIPDRNEKMRNQRRGHSFPDVIDLCMRTLCSVRTVLSSQLALLYIY